MKCIVTALVDILEQRWTSRIWTLPAKRARTGAKQVEVGEKADGSLILSRRPHAWAAVFPYAQPSQTSIAFPVVGLG